MKVKNSFKVLILIFCIFCFENMILAGESFKILAYVNEKAVTEHDLKIFMKITKNNNREKALKEYVELIQYAEIADRIGIKLDKKDKADYWLKFKAKFKINHNKVEFCKKNGIDEKFLDNYIRMTAIWEIYYDNFIARNINIRRDTIIENMEITGKATIENSYNLSEIVLNYSNDKQKREAKSKIENISNDINSNKISFSAAAKSISNSKSAKENGYIGWVNGSDFSNLFINAIKEAEIGNITSPICVDGNIKGLCVVFMVHDSKTVINTDEKEEIRVFNDFHKKTINMKIIETVSSYDDTIKVKYNL